jgi:two-component system nitrate/nitrite response regulator NarL
MRAAVIVGSNNLFREGLIRILIGENFIILDAVAHIDGAVLDVMAMHDSILFIIDAGEGSNAVLDQIRLIKARNPKWCAVVLDHVNQLPSAISVYRAGASAYLVNVATPVAFIKILELVMLGETILPAAFLPFVLEHESLDETDGERHGEGEISGIGIGQEGRAAADDAPLRQLSAREKVVLRCIIGGCSNKAIARRIAISEATVKVHVKSILRKIRVHSRTQAAIWGMNCGLSVWQVGNGAMLPATISPQPVEPRQPQQPLPALPPVRRSESSLFTAAALRRSEPW